MNTNHQLLVTGRTAVIGEKSGRVCKIMTSKEAHLVKEGAILVTPMTDPDMVPAMQRAAAIVTERGGMLCHAAIVCREMGKTCVVGTKNAFKVLDADAEVLVLAAPGNGSIYGVNKQTTGNP